MPSVRSVGATHDSAAEPEFAAPATATVKAGRLAVLKPSLAVTVTVLDLPASALVGTPLSVPVRGSKFAHAGLPATMKTSG